jgi:hypothetical protein
MRKITYTCDVCGTEKQPSNGWILARNTKSGIWFNKWAEDLETVDSMTHLCGDECAAKHLSRFLSGPPTRRIAKTSLKSIAKTMLDIPEGDEDDFDGV